MKSKFGYLGIVFEEVERCGQCGTPMPGKGERANFGKVCRCEVMGIHNAGGACAVA